MTTTETTMDIGLIRDAMQAMLKTAKQGDLPGPCQFLTLEGCAVLGIRAADLTRFMLWSEAGRMLWDWLPVGNRRALALRDALAGAGWLVMGPSGRSVLLRDRVIGAKRYAAVLYVRIRVAA